MYLPSISTQPLFMSLSLLPLERFQSKIKRETNSKIHNTSGNTCTTFCGMKLLPNEIGQDHYVYIHRIPYNHNLYRP